MRPIAILILGMGLMGSAVVQAQEAGQGSAVPRQPVLVAQAGTFTSPGSPVVAAPAVAPAAMMPVMAVFAVSVAAIAISGANASSNH
jgi:hypothetical protein